jgi:predicted transcriptional regulator
MTKIMTFRFPPDLVKEIVSRAQATGKDRTAVVVEALSQVFGLPLPSPTSTTAEALWQQLNQLEDIAVNLSEQVAELQQKLYLDNSLFRRLDALEQAVAALQTLPTAAAEAKETLLHAGAEAVAIEPTQLKHQESDENLIKGNGTSAILQNTDRSN